jgi:hypothetical protein
MNHINQQKLVPVEGTTRAVSDKTSGEQTPKGAVLVSFEEMQRRVNAFFDDFTEAFKNALKPHGIEIGALRILWHPVDLTPRKILAAARLVPEVKVVVAKDGNELPS